MTLDARSVDQILVSVWEKSHALAEIHKFPVYKHSIVSITLTYSNLTHNGLCAWIIREMRSRTHSDKRSFPLARINIICVQSGL